MRKLILSVTIILLLFAAKEPYSLQYGKRIVFMPFYDESGYRGPWDLGYQVPEMLGDMLGGTDDYFIVVPMDTIRSIMSKPETESAVMKFLDLFRNKKRIQKILTDAEVLSVARKLKGDIAITGVVSDFNMRRTGGGEPMIGGYKSYTTKVEVDQVRVLRVTDG